jgi:cell division protein FtsN
MSTHHDTEDGFHEIQLSGKQLVFLFIATTTVAVAIFLCGVHVGRGVKSDRAADSAETLAQATPPPAASTPSRPSAAGGPPAGEPPAPAPEPEDELSYAKRLQATAPPAEKLKPEPAKSTPPASVAAPGVRPQTKPAAPPPKADATTATSGHAGAWIVQLTALQDRAAAASLARKLSAKGYPAFVLDPTAGAPVIYRVQVGGYADRREAEQAARRLEKDEQFKPIVRAR